MSVTVAVATEATNELLDALHALVPQLSSKAQPLEFIELKEIVKQDATTMFVARDDEKIIGVLTLVCFRIPTGLRAVIEDVVVDQDSQGHGVGEALTRNAIEYAREKGAASVDLTSRPSRRSANRLYGRIGFEKRETNVYRFLVEPPGGDSQ
jgi:ribosomal protein S18 acetylase RimI-like enzyme